MNGRIERRAVAPGSNPLGAAAFLAGWALIIFATLYFFVFQVCR